MILDRHARAQARAFLLGAQEADGALPWTDPVSPWRAFDPWNHLQGALGLMALDAQTGAQRALRHLIDTQPADGLWLAHCGAAVDPDDPSPEPLPLVKDLNFAAYIAVAAWRSLACPTSGLDACVRRALDAVLAWQAPCGRFPWAPGADEALVASNAAIRMALRCGEELAQSWRDADTWARWRRARLALDAALRRQATEEATTEETGLRWRDDTSYAMDWYYPVLSGALTGEAARARLDARWQAFIAPTGCRCVRTQPWRTAAETAEVAIACLVAGETAKAASLVPALRAMRAPSGGFWTGYQDALAIFWPATITPWTCATIALADEALRGAGPFLALAALAD